MNEFLEKNWQVYNNSLNKFADKPISDEPALIQISWLTRIFGCWHKKMGIPFTRGRQTYRTCISCGACQKYDLKLSKTTGPFYYNPVLALYDPPAEKTLKNCDISSSPGLNEPVDKEAIKIDE